MLGEVGFGSGLESGFGFGLGLESGFGFGFGFGVGVSIGGVVWGGLGSSMDAFTGRSSGDSKSYREICP